MTIVTPSYHDPDPEHKITVPSLIPEGTIFMFGWSFDYCNGEDNEYPNPLPHNYFKTRMDAYKAALPLFHAEDASGKLIHAPYYIPFNDSPFIFEIEDGLLHCPVYIYIWAVPKAGAA